MARLLLLLYDGLRKKGVLGEKSGPVRKTTHLLLKGFVMNSAGAMENVTTTTMTTYTVRCLGHYLLKSNSIAGMQFYDKQ